MRYPINILLSVIIVDEREELCVNDSLMQAPLLIVRLYMYLYIEAFFFIYLFARSSSSSVSYSIATGSIRFWYSSIDGISLFLHFLVFLIFLIFHFFYFLVFLHFRFFSQMRREASYVYFDRFDKSEINLDGGNILTLPCSEKVIIGDRVFSENPEYGNAELIRKLETFLHMLAARFFGMS